MASLDHEMLVQAVRDSPGLVVTLLASRGHLVAHDARVTLGDPALPLLVPTLAADALVEVESGGEKCVVVVEAQLRPDARKRFSWPCYQAHARYRHECAAVVLVIAPDAETAAWAIEPVHLDALGSKFRAAVFGPEELAAIDVARASPELLWLRAYALRGDLARGPEAIARARDALTATRPAHETELYFDTLVHALSEGLRAHLEDLMSHSRAENGPKDPLLMRLMEVGLARQEALDLGRREGVDLGRREGVDLGRREGVDLGRREALTAAVLLVLDSRGVLLSEVERARIRDERDDELLRVWLSRAASATAIDEVLAA